MGHEDLTIALGHNINNPVLVMANIKTTEVWKINYFVLSDGNCVQNDLFCHNNSMLDIFPNGIEYSSWAICVGHLQHPNP